jgi:hypothetical protein
MKKIKLIATISLLILATVMISSSTFAQKQKTKTFTYYVNVHFPKQSIQQLYSEPYRIEIWDQYGFRVLAPQTSRPGEHIYVFKETVPISVTGFNRVARFIFSPNWQGGSLVLWANPDTKSVLYPGNYFFNLYPVPMEQNFSSDLKQ